VKVIYGKNDTAGKNISRALSDQFAVETKEIEYHPVFYNYPEREIGAAKGELIIIPSQHKSEKNIRSLTVHAAGNFDSSELGGFKQKMSPYDARMARSILMNISKYGSGLGYEITYEATHHGPFSENPIIFVEIGSSEKEYGDADIGYVMARSIYEAFDEESEIYCALGGLHYPGKFTRIALKQGISIGHIASKHRFNEINQNILKEMMAKTPGASGFFIEEKSFNSEQRRKLEDMLDELSFAYKLV
jgi:D-aminoacyl-tRNA deacylase